MGSTLVETLIAIILTVIVSGVAMSLFVQVYKSENKHQKLSAFFKMKELMIETTQKQRLFDEQFKFETYTVKKTVSPYQNFKDIFLVNLSAYDSDGKKIETISQLIYIPG